MKRSEPGAKALIGLPLTRAAAVLVLAALPGLSACSLMPDPEDPETVRKARGQAASSESKGFPSLGSVPRQAPRTSSSAERRRTVQGLAAARRDARSRLPRLDLRPEAGASAAAVPPPPSAVPRARAAPPASVPRPVAEPGNGSPRMRAADRTAAADASAETGQQVLLQTFARALARSGNAAAAAPPDASFGAPAASTPDSPIAAPAPGASATVHFANGSARLNGEARAIVRGVAEAWKTRGGAVRVVGHASRGTGELAPRRRKLANFHVSLDRATAVANELIRLGVDGSAVQVAAVGDSRPALDESTPEGEAENRRAEIFHSF